MSNAAAEKWMEVRPEGLYCKAADVYIDPTESVKRAIITHGHADHARSGHGEVFATPETIDIMRTRYYLGEETQETELVYGQRIDLGGGVTLWFASAGHILGSAQAVLEYDGTRVVAAGDYKRHPDPTCAPFEVVPCDVFITEATFALPVFQHPPLEAEVQKLLRSLRALPERTHIVGVYALGKCQRVMKTLRLAGYEDPFYLHGALKKLTELYESTVRILVRGRWLAIFLALISMAFRAKSSFAHRHKSMTAGPAASPTRYRLWRAAGCKSEPAPDRNAQRWRSSSRTTQIGVISSERVRRRRRKIFGSPMAVSKPWNAR